MLQEFPDFVFNIKIVKGPIMKMYLIAILVLLASMTSFADTEEVNRQTIISKRYNCSNGGTIQLFETPYGNVKKVVISKSNKISQFAFVSFWMMTDQYVGNVHTSMTFPDRSTGEEPIRGETFAELEIKFNGRGLNLEVKPHGNSKTFSCINY
jgi:hypothetical protein